MCAEIHVHIVRIFFVQFQICLVELKISLAKQAGKRGQPVLALQNWNLVGQNGLVKRGTVSTGFAELESDLSEQV